MNRPRIKLLFFAAFAELALAAFGCGDSVSPGSGSGPEPGPSQEADSGTPPGTRDSGDAARAPADGGGDAATGVADPTQKGPFAIAEVDATTKVSATGDDVPIHCAYPTGAGGPFPVIVVAHGFQLPASQYYGYVRRLASFGYVAMTADYPAGFSSVSNVRDAKNLSGALDWAMSAPELASRASIAKSGVMGHSRGGKAAVLAAAADSRFVAVLGLDPVDSKPPGGCDATTECPDSRDALASRAIPSALLGETTDGTSGTFGQPCAPADGNFATYYAKAKSPSYEFAITGANHMSFLDDPGSCGFTCSLCRPATASHATVLALSYAMSVAFFERHIRGNAAYEAYLSGPQAQTLWVASGVATIASK